MGRGSLRWHRRPLDTYDVLQVFYHAQMGEGDVQELLEVLDLSPSQMIQLTENLTLPWRYSL